jgi:hypothetical protein
MKLAFMLDIETLSTQTNAVVLSIALTRFEPEASVITVLDKYPTKVWYPSPFEQRSRDISIETVHFWINQTREAQKTAFRAVTQPLDQIHHEMYRFLQSAVDQDPPEIWANSPAFDCTIVESLFANFKPLWSFRQPRDLRTLKSIAGSLSPEELQLANMLGPNRHSAADDAIYQAVQVQLLMKKVKK